MIIETSTRQHAYSEQVTSEIHSAYPEGYTRVVSDAVALTIAAWFQSPSPAGAAFAELASRGRVDADTLYAAIDREQWRLYVDSEPYRALTCLRRWAAVKEARMA